VKTYSHSDREEGWRRICEILGNESGGADLEAAVVSLRQQLGRCPRDPWLRLARGVAQTSLGRHQAAHDDFRFVEENARQPWVRLFARELLSELERWQLAVLSTLLQEDRAFRIAFRSNPNQVLRERGFCLSPMGYELLGALERTMLRNAAVPPGIA